MDFVKLNIQIELVVTTFYYTDGIDTYKVIFRSIYCQGHVLAIELLVRFTLIY